MRLLDKLFGRKEAYPPLPAGSEVVDKLDEVKAPLEELAHKVSDHLEVVPADHEAFVFLGTPPTHFGIAWIHDGQAGIEFDDPLSDAEVAALQAAPIHTPTPTAEDYRRPGFGRKTGNHPRWSDGTGWIDG